MTGTPSRLLDARGLKCPKPIIELAKLARDLADGTEVTVLSDDPAAPGDIAAWCRMRGHEHLSHSGARSVLRVRRTPPAAEAAAMSPAGPGTPAG